MNCADVYIHVPFCRSKCAYCAFYSTTAVDETVIAAYLAKLERDLAGSEFSRPLQSLYLGGGTPSLLDDRQLRQLFRLLTRHLPLAETTEISIECNPETLTPEKCEHIGALCNRISLGVQSFQPCWRHKLGRQASQQNIFRAFAMFQALGIDNLNCDLIYGLRGQTADAWRRDLETALACGVRHLSCYALTPEENTLLGEAPETALDPERADELAAELWEQTGELLQAAGLPRYEISNYAAAGFRCRHNTRVWLGRPYRGFGPAAASFDGRQRFSQVESLAGWLDGAPPIPDPLPPARRWNELFAIQLRTTDGWNQESFDAVPLQEIHPCDWSVMQQKCEELLKCYPGTLEITADSIKLTEFGLQFWNSIAAELL